LNEKLHANSEQVERNVKEEVVACLKKSSRIARELFYYLDPVLVLQVSLLVHSLSERIIWPSANMRGKIKIWFSNYL
jgi:hypothetical protein